MFKTALYCDKRFTLPLAAMMFIECSFKQSGRTFFVGWRVETRGAPSRAPRYLAQFPSPLPSCSPLPEEKSGRTFFVGWRVVAGGARAPFGSRLPFPPPPAPPSPRITTTVFVFRLLSTSLSLITIRLLCVCAALAVARPGALRVPCL